MYSEDPAAMDTHQARLPRIGNRLASTILTNSKVSLGGPKPGSLQEKGPFVVAQLTGMRWGFWPPATRGNAGLSQPSLLTWPRNQ